MTKIGQRERVLCIRACRGVIQEDMERDESIRTEHGLHEHDMRGGCWGAVSGPLGQHERPQGVGWPYLVPLRDRRGEGGRSAFSAVPPAAHGLPVYCAVAS